MKTVLIDNHNFINSWVVGLQNIDTNGIFIPAGDNYPGIIPQTKDCKLIVSMGKNAISQIKRKMVHPLYPLKQEAVEEYCKQYSYEFVEEQSKLPDGHNSKFAYTYMERFIKYPIIKDVPNVGFKNKFAHWLGFTTKREYFDQIRWLNDIIREDGISRRHQIITWIPGQDNESTEPPCLQKIQLRRLSSKHKAIEGKIPIEAQFDFRSRDFYGAFPSNDIALTEMLYKYVLKDEFELIKLTDVSFSGHIYERDIPNLKGISILPDFYGGKQ